MHEEFIAIPMERTVDRRGALRAVLGGAAAAAVLTAPRIESFSLAPDYAAAASCPLIDMSFGTRTNQNGWVQTVTGSFQNSSQNRGVGTNWHGLGNGVYAHIVERNNTSAMSVTYRKTIGLTAGYTYTFTFKSSGAVTNPITQTLRASLWRPNNNSEAGFTQFTTADGRATGWIGHHSFSVAVTTTGVYTFVFAHSAPRPGSGQANDDIGVTAPTVTCRRT